MVGLLINRGIALADARARIELQKRLNKSKEMTSANQRRQEPQNLAQAQQRRDQAPGPGSEPIGDWVPELLEQFGIDPDLIFEDEMPPELKTFLPMAKAYVNAQGGLPGIAAKLGQGAAPPDESKGI
jgi:hypothetical protein